MKTMICLIVMLAISKYASAEVCTAPLASYCQRCSGDVCLKCFSWGVGIHADKTWAVIENTTPCTTIVDQMGSRTTCGGRDSLGTTCDGTIPSSWKVTDCKLNGEFDPIEFSNKDHPRCLICDAKKFIYYDYELKEETCTDTAPAAITTCVEIENCQQTLCFSAKNNEGVQTNYVFCSLCDYNKGPTNVDLKTGFNSECGEVLTPITNCNLYYHEIDFWNTQVVQYDCIGCDYGYSLDHTSKKCLVYSDKGCRYLDENDVHCHQCWWSYVFNQAECVLRSYLSALAGLISFVALLLVQ